MTTITTLAQLEALYGEAHPASRKKEVPRLTPAYRQWIEAAPFFAMATSGPGGLDCTPRGDPVGELIHIIDDKTVAFGDRRGNNRLDSLRNLLTDPRMALLFLVPGISETLRINGRAVISTDAALIARFAKDGKAPTTVIIVSIDSVYFQCAKALIRSQLWDPARRVERGRVPTAGQMVKAVDAEFDAAGYDIAAPARLNETLY